MEIIASLIEGGCYSAVFAILLFTALRTSSRREEAYRKVIIELAETVRNLDSMDGKLDRLIVTCDKLTAKKPKKEKRVEKEVSVCDHKLLVVSEVEG